MRLFEERKIETLSPLRPLALLFSRINISDLHTTEYRPTLLRIGLAIAVLAALMVNWAMFFSVTHDDSYIVARCAANLVDHGALVFNLGERINVLTSPLDALLQAVIYACAGRDQAIAGHQVVNAFWFLSGIALLLWRFCTAVARSLILTMGLLSPYLWHWAFGGLDTLLLFLFVVILSIASATVRHRPSVAYLLSAVTGLAFLTRYDSILFSVPICAHAIMNAQEKRRVVLALLCGALLPIAWLVLSWSYYGDVLPTSFYTKTPGLQPVRVAMNGGYIVEFLFLSGIIPACVLILWAAHREGVWSVVASRGPKDVRICLRCIPYDFGDVWGIAVGIALELLYGLSAATTHMMFSFRLLLPYLPAILVVLCHLDAQAAEHGYLYLKRSRQAFMLFFFLIVGAQVLQASTIFSSSLNGMSTIGEWQNAGTREVMERHNGALERIAAVITKHSESVAHNPRPRVYSPAEGLIAYRLPDASIYGDLSAYRHKCRLDILACDYILVWRSMGKVLTVGPEDYSGLTEIASYATVISDHDANVSVYFNPRTHAFDLPSTIDGASCSDGKHL
jgi:hypothetical protein